MNPTPVKSGPGLITVSDTGTAPKSRLDDYLSAATVVENLRKASESRTLHGARIRAQFDGNPPFNPTKLQQAGLKGYPNFNTLEAKAYLSSALVPYYDLFSNAPFHMDVTLDIADAEQRDLWSKIVTEELHRAVSESSWFDLNMWKMLSDFVGFGKGFLIRPDNRTWHFKRVSWDRVWFPDETDVDPQEWSHFAVIWHYNAHDLYKRVRNKERAEQIGWNTDATLKAIQAAAQYRPENVNDWVGIQQKLKDHDIEASTTCEKIPTAWLFVKEFDGRWSWMILPLPDITDPGNKKVPKEQHGFLYRKIGLYDSVDEIITPFFYEVFDGSVNGLSGLGKDIFAPMQLKDRMACAKFFNVFMRSSILMQARSSTGRQKAALAQIGNVTVIPEGYEVQQSTILGDIESTIAVGRDLDLMLQSNTGIYRPQFEKPQGNPETATAASLRFQQGTILGNSAVNRFHRQLDGLYYETYRRIVKSGEKDAMQFRQWCVQRGVPEEALGKVRCVKSYRNIGNGSAFLRQTNIASLAAFYAEMPEDGKQHFLADVVAAYTGQQKVESYVRTPMAKNIPTRHVWEATQENAALKEAAPVVWTPEQDDITHLAVHAKALQEALGGVQQGADPAAVAVFGQGVIAHVQAHIASLQRKKRDAQVKQWTGIYKALAGAVDELIGQIQQAQQQQAQQAQRTQQVLTDQELKQFKTASDIRIKETKTDAQLQQSSEKHRLKMAQGVQDLSLKDFSTSAEIERERLKAQAEMNRKAATNGNGDQGT